LAEALGATQARLVEPDYPGAFAFLSQHLPPVELKPDRYPRRYGDRVGPVGALPPEWWSPAADSPLLPL
jgi:hypothetical protein